MKILLLVAIFFVPSLGFAVNKQENARQAQCLKAAADEPYLKVSDFSWRMLPEQMENKFKEIYESGKRLKGRAYLDTSKKKWFIESELLGLKRRVEIPPRFIDSITKHVEIALERKVVDYVFFPDMGHSHYFIPKKIWDEMFSKIEAREELYERIFALSELKILYHTAEQLKMTESPRGGSPLILDNRLLWRYFTRNLIGLNKASDEIEIHYAWDNSGFNTLGVLEGFHYYGGGFNISSSKDACFPYQWKGKTFYFDISLEDLPYDNDGGDYIRVAH